jgi:hypothetical protein
MAEQQDHNSGGEDSVLSGSSGQHMRRGRHTSTTPFAANNLTQKKL